MSFDRLLNSPDWVRLSAELRAFFRRHFNDEAEAVEVAFRHLKPARLPLSLSLPGQPDPARLSGAPAAAAPWHSTDFQLVRRGADAWSFSAKQRLVVQALWDAWERGEPEVTERSLLTVAGSECVRLQDLFRSSAAWGTLLVKAGRGTLYRLSFPTAAEQAQADALAAQAAEEGSIRREPVDSGDSGW